MIVFEVPKSDGENFRMIRNDLTAFDYLWNARFRLIDCPVPTNCLLGPPGKGLAQALSSLAKGRGGIGVNSAAKTFKLLAHLILDPEAQKENSSSPAIESKPGEPNAGGWTSFRSTFGKPIGSAPRIQTWIGRAAAHGLAGRVLGDLCFRLAANGVRDETQGMIAKVYATKTLLQTAINCYQIQGGRSVHTDEIRNAILAHKPLSAIREMAKQDGMRSLREDGMAKAIQGLTTVEEVMRITREDAAAEPELEPAV